MTAPRVLLTGATGYIGGRRLAELERRGVSVRCFVRRPEALRGRAAPSTEIAAGDALDSPAVARALEGVDAAYYLIHSMGGEDFAARDRESARIEDRHVVRRASTHGGRRTEVAASQSCYRPPIRSRFRRDSPIPRTARPAALGQKGGGSYASRPGILGTRT